MSRIKEYTEEELKKRNAESRKKYYNSEKGKETRRKYKERMQQAYKESKIILTEEEKKERRRQSRIKYYNRMMSAKNKLDND